MNVRLIFFTLLFVSLGAFMPSADAQKTTNHLSIHRKFPNKLHEDSFSKKVDSLSGSQIINKNIDALGGLEALKNIQSLDFEGSLEIGGMHLNFSERKAFPNLDYIALSIDKDTIMRSVFDGKSGYNQEIAQKKMLSEEEIKERNLDNIGLFNQLYYLDSSKQFTLNKIYKSSSSDSSSYVLDIKMPSGKNVLEFYDSKNFLLVKSIETETIEGETVVTEKKFGNYKKINGIQFPYAVHIIKTKDGKDQEIDINIETTQINLPTE